MGSHFLENLLKNPSIPKELLRFICDFSGCFLPNCLVGRYLDVFRGDLSGV